MAGPMAATWGDLTVGVDIHIVMVPSPAGPVPTPMPHPYLGLIGDPAGAVVGAFTSTMVSLCLGGPPSPPRGITLVNGLPAATTADASKNVPLLAHLPMPPGAAFQKPPKGASSYPLGSQTVAYGGAAVVRLGEIARSCGDPVDLPLSSVVTIPKGPPVLIGGPAVPNLAEAAGNLLAGAAIRTAFGAASKALRLVARLGATRLRNLLPKARCWLTGHPVDITTGRVITDAVDFELPGPIPLVFERNYSSGWSRRLTSMGHGWSHSLDRALWTERSGVVCRLADGRELVFDASEFPNREVALKRPIFDPIAGYTLTRLAPDKWQLVGEDGLIEEFQRVQGETAPEAVSAGLCRILRTTRRNARLAIQYAYEVIDGHARLVAVKDSGGRSVGFRHDEVGRLREVLLPHPEQPDERVVHATYEYSEAGDLVAVRDAVGAVTRYEYSGTSHLLTRETDRNGLSFYWIYDGRSSAARCVRTWGDGGIYNQKLLYNPAARITIVIDSDGNKTKYTANELGLVVEVEDALGGKRRFAYDENLRLAHEEDALGRKTVQANDDRGRTYAIRHPDGARRIWKYGHDRYPELVTLMRNERGGVWRARYDSRGQLVAIRGPFSSENVSFEWREGLLVAEHRGAEHITFAYDRWRNLVEVRGPRWHERRAYDRQGRLTEVTTPLGRRRFTYDLVGRVVRVEEPDGNIRELRRDAEGNVLEARDKLRVRRFRYAGFNWLAAVEEDGTEVGFEYEAEGELRTILNEKRQPYGFWYDPCRRLLRERGFDRRYIDYKRDKAGQVVSITRANGTTALTYDDRGNVTGHAYPDGTSDAFTYGLDGLLDTATNASAEVRFERDVAGRIVREHQGAEWVATTYAGAELYQLESSRGALMRVSRDESGAPSRIHLGPPWAGHGITIAYDAAGLETERRLPGGITARWDHDSTGRPRASRVLRDDQRDWAREYVWNLDDRLTAIVDSRFGRAEYVHDGRGRLVAEQREDGTLTRAFDAVGNVYRAADLSDRSYATGGVIRNDGETTFAFDGVGNMVERREPGGRTWRYAWDGAGMLVEVVRPDGANVAFSYDALGRRVSKKSGERETRWIWDGNTVLHESVSHGPDVTWYHEPDGLVPLAKVEDERVFSVVADHLGTPTAMYDDAGKLAWQTALDAFGCTREETNTSGADTCPWRFPGQYEDEETGLYYNRLRYYDGTLGFYLSQDPIGLLGSFSLFAYVEDPTISIDPFGLAREPVRPGDAGRYADLRARSVVGDSLTPHHMPQAAAGFTSYADGGAVVLPDHEHARTRTFGSAGRKTLRQDRGLDFRTAVARDIRDLRRLFGSRYDASARALLAYYRGRFPDLMMKRGGCQ